VFSPSVSHKVKDSMRVFSPAISASFAQPGANYHSNDGNPVLQQAKRDKPKALRAKKTSTRRNCREVKGSRKEAEEAFGDSKCLANIDYREIRSPHDEGGKAAVSTEQRVEAREYNNTVDSPMTSPSQRPDQQERAADSSALRTSKKRVQRGFAERHRKTAFFDDAQGNENNTYTCNSTYTPNFPSVKESMSVQKSIAERESVEESPSEHAEVPMYMTEDVSSYTSCDESMATDDASSYISYDDSIAESYHSILSEASGYSINSIKSEVGHIQEDVTKGFLLFLYELYPKHILGSKPSLLKYSRKKIPKK
jgi:hypothetical protein